MLYQGVYQVTLCLSAKIQKEAAQIGLKRSRQINCYYMQYIMHRVLFTCLCNASNLSLTCVVWYLLYLLSSNPISFVFRLPGPIQPKMIASGLCVHGTAPKPANMIHHPTPHPQEGRDWITTPFFGYIWAHFIGWGLEGVLAIYDDIPFLKRT